MGKRYYWCPEKEDVGAVKKKTDYLQFCRRGTTSYIFFTFSIRHSNAILLSFL
jgi:hypothetical protein